MIIPWSKIGTGPPATTCIFSDQQDWKQQNECQSHLKLLISLLQTAYYLPNDSDYSQSHFSSLLVKVLMIKAFMH